jgi:hypothetical protein
VSLGGGVDRSEGHGRNVSTRRSSDANRRKRAGQRKRKHKRRANANGCAKRAARRAPDRGNECGFPNRKSRTGKVSTSGDASPRTFATVAPLKRCAECRRRRLWLRRGLCWACYGDPIIRGRHFDPEHTRLARNPDMRDALDLLHGVDVPAERAAPCPGPLPGFAGSPERQLALGMRADALQVLFPERGAPLSLAGVGKLFGVSTLAG